MSGSISYSSVLGIRGSIMVIKTEGKLGYEELVEIELNNGEKRLGRSLQASEDTAVVEVFEGTPHDMLASQIARQSTIATGEEFAVVFGAIGVPADTAMFFRKELEESGALKRSVLFLNLAEDPAIERIVTPRIALTAAEYLAFEQGLHVLTILTDITNYGEALREISILRDEVPSRRGYPGYLYTDLATIFERSGKVAGKKGSLTQLPILSMPGDDITHPIPDLTAYITEGQIVLDKDLYHRGVYPPVNVLMSLSRLMKDGVGEGKTRADHKELSDQLYNSYSKAIEVRSLVEIVGREGVPASSVKYLDFADKFEKNFMNQGQYENRDIETTLNLAWEVISELPDSELTNISAKSREVYSNVVQKRSVKV